MKVNIKGGGTFNKWAPPVIYTQHILLPVVRKMGYRANIEILRHGFYPRGGANVKVEIKPCKKLLPLNLTNRGSVEDFGGLSIASNHLAGKKVAERME